MISQTIQLKSAPARHGNDLVRSKPAVRLQTMKYGFSVLRVPAAVMPGASQASFSS